MSDHHTKPEILAAPEQPPAEEVPECGDFRCTIAPWGSPSNCEAGDHDCVCGLPFSRHAEGVKRRRPVW